ncbi:hypothetical protein ACOSZH_16630 [Priestia megaterium]|uniref:hypothetical protein n=1 Tax=Priestia megaterium TaxID=1404 RepID=UPI003BA311D6
MKFINCYTFYFKILIRTWIIPILFLGIFVFGLYTFFLGKSLNDPTLVLIANPLILALMACYLFIGIYVTKIDEKDEIYETFSIIKNAMLYKTLAKWLLIFSSVVLFAVLFFALYLYIFFTPDFNNKTYFLSVFKYICLYWALPSFIMFLLGNLLSTWMRGRFVYLIALVIYGITIPMNYAIFRTEGNIPSKFRIDKILSLGEPNVTRIYNSLYGFSLDLIYWDKMILIVSLLAILFLLTWKKKEVISKNQLQISLLPVLLIFVATTVYAVQPFQSLTDDDGKSIRYYRQHKIKEDSSLESPVNLKKYDIKLRTKSNLSALVKIQAVNIANKDIKQLTVGLFHELHVEQIKMDDKEIKFKQKNDSLTLYFEDNAWQPNDNRVLEFKYKGLQSNLYFGNAQAVYLPNYIPWLPTEDSRPAFDIVTKYHYLHRVPHQPSERKTYKLKVDGTNKLFTNLPRNGHGNWEGVSSDGVSLFSGQLSSKVDDDVRYVYPNTWESQFKQPNNIQRYLSDVAHAMKTTLKDDTLKVPHTIYFVPNQNIADGIPHEGTWWNDDYVIWGFNQSDYPTEPFFTVDYLGDFTPQLVFARTKHLSKQDDFTFNILFANAYGRALNSTLKLPNDGTDVFIDTILGSLGDSSLDNNLDTLEINQQFNTWLRNKESLNPKSPVYKKWSSLIQHPTSQKWNILYDLLKQENSK